MNRIDSPTAEADTHGTGKDGFTDGDPQNGIPPTHFNAKWCNSVQEEICRCVEGNGDTIDEDTHSQLDDAVQSMAAINGPVPGVARYILHGFDPITSGASLTVTMTAGQFVWDGRRYVITDEKLADAGHDSFTLTANRDAYFYIAPEDPGAPATPPNRRTVHIEVIEVANGAAAPSTPTGTIRFLKLVTDGSGVTSKQPYGHGPMLLAGNGRGIRVRRDGLGTATQVSVIPNQNGSVNLGLFVDPELATPEEGRLFREVAYQSRYMRSTYDSRVPRAGLHEWHAYAHTTGGEDTADIVIATKDDYFDGAVVSVIAHVVAINENDQDGFYWARIEFGAGKETGFWNVDGSTVGAVVREFGTEAIADGVGVAGVIDVSGNLTLRLTGRTEADQLMRWSVRIEVDQLNPPADIP